MTAAGSSAAAADARVLLVSVPDVETGERLAQQLVQEEIVACGSVLPGMRSIYRWQGVIEQAGEALVLLKTTVAGAERALERIPLLHPYDVPEVLVLAVAGGYGAYLEWIASSVGTLQQRD